jgi:HK97 gp10 family phage protein
MAPKSSWKFNSRIKAVYSEIFKNTDEEIQSWGTDAVTIAQRLAPKDTGELAEKIHMEDAAQVTKFLVGRKMVSDATREDGHSYAAHVEFGTAHNPAQPHMIPAVRVARMNTLGRIKRKGLV